jgi:hypothetical protein
MQGIYNYMPGTNHVSMAHNVTATLWLQYRAQARQCCFPCQICYTVTSVLPQYACSASMAVCCSSCLSCWPVVLLRYFLNNLQTVSVANIFTGITFVFTFHLHCISVISSSYFKIFSASLSYFYVIKLQRVNRHFPFPLSRIMMSGLLLGAVLSVITFLIPQYGYLNIFHNFRLLVSQ